MSAWDKLSMSEKADVMKLALEGGVYDLDSIREGYNKFAEGGKVYKSKYTGTVWNTEAEAVADSKRYFNDVEYRYLVKSNKVKHTKEYAIPFKPEKKITLSNAGVATGGILSTNLLDSIADAAVKTGLPIKTAIGLAVKESTLGNPTDDRSIYKILSPDERKKFKLYGTGQHINKKGEALNPRTLVNFYKDVDPYMSAILYADNNYKKLGKSYEQMLIDGEKYTDSQRKGFEEKYSGHNVLYNAFKDYKSNPNGYNPGQPNYPQLVEKRGNEVWNSPEVQTWYKEYSKRKKNKGFDDGKTTGYVRDKNDHPIAFDAEGNLVDQVTGEKGIMNIPEVTISPSRYTRDLYSSAFDPNAPIEFINTITAGGLNNLSPTQWARRAYDTVGLINGDMSQGQYIDSWINGNNGIVTDKFAEEHPYWSTGINMVGDALAMGIGSQASKFPKYRRLERNFTGVPHRQVKINDVPQFDSSGKPIYMDESFPTTHSQHTVWTSNDVDYAANGTWSTSKNNPVFDVYTDPKTLKTLDTPTPEKGDMYWWMGLPFDLREGKALLSKKLGYRTNAVPKTKDISIRGGGVNGNYSADDLGRYVHKEGQESPLILDWNDVPGAVKTDDVVKYSKKYGYDATRFHNIFDGSSYIGGNKTAFNYPIDELVLNSGTEKYILPHGTPKWKVFNQLPTNPIFKNPTSYSGITAPFINIMNNRHD